jgi:tetratricopeptide (TPR) repeat protein
LTLVVGAPFEHLAAAGAMLDGYARDESRPVNLGALRNAATAIGQAGDRLSARKIMEFVYTRQLDREELTRPVFLGLAEIRIQQGDIAGALTLLRRLTLVVGAPFEHLAAAGAMLERLNRPGDALEFRRAHVQAAPWDAAAQIALSRTEIAANVERTAALDRLARIAESAKEDYAVRVEAARAWAAAGGVLGREPQTELDGLRAVAALTPAAADRPMFVAARLAAAERATDNAERVKLLLAAVAVDPDDGLTLRVPLFRALLAAGKPAEAIDAMQPILARSRTLTNINLSAAGRARLAREVGEAHRQTDRLPEAVRYFTIALEGQTAAVRAPIQQRLTAINQEISRRASNEARRPKIWSGLDQQQVVRRRIPPPAAATTPRPAAPAPAQGGAR